MARILGSRVGILGGAILLVAMAGVAGLSALTPAVTGTAAADSVGPYSTWIETRASGAFDPATPQLRGLRADYRVDAHVLLPLGFTSLEIWSRPDVGMAEASYRDCQADASEIVRAYELFSASRPERARGFDRRGLFREALRMTSGGVAWTAYFGAMTSWPERTLSDARKAVGGPQPHTYEAIDGISTPLETRSSVFRVATDGKLNGPGDLWAALRPQLGVGRPRSVQLLSGTQMRPLPPIAFLGALEMSLRSAAVHRDHPLSPSATHVAFTHDGSVRTLELTSVLHDVARGRVYLGSGLVRNPADVYQLHYRILNPGHADGEFCLWTELPPGARDDAEAPPIAPLGWELQLRSYLKLVFERIS